MNLKVFRNTSIDEWRRLSKRNRYFESTLVELDIPIISDNNAILFEKEDPLSSYIKTFNLQEIRSGLIKYNDQFYWFDHDIVNTPRHRFRKCFSYKIFPITDDMGERIYNEKIAHHWEIFFNSFINYNKIYLSTGHIEDSIEGELKTTDRKNHCYKATIIDDSIFLPVSVTASDLKDGETVDEFLSKLKKNYRNVNVPKLEINRPVIRNNYIKK